MEEGRGGNVRLRTAPSPQFKKYAKNAFLKITKIPTSDFYSVNPLEEEFHDYIKHIILNQVLIISGTWKGDNP